MVPFGLIVGSVLSMVATRVPDGLPVFSPGPQCPGCEHDLGWGELIPIVSWVTQGRACKHCQNQLSFSYPAIELTTALLFVAAALEFGDLRLLVPHLVLFAALVAISVTDLYLYRIPDRIVFPTLAVSLLMIIAASLSFDSPDLIGPALFGMVAYFGFLGVLWLIYPPGMGLGDVKLALLLGLFVGWAAAGSYAYAAVFVLYSLFLGSMIFTVFSVLLVFARSRGIDLLPDPDEDDYRDTSDDVYDDDGELQRGSSKTHTGAPMGPALAIGAIILVLFPGSFA